MAGAGPLQAYLEYQAEIGAEEVMLPYPLARTAALPAAEGKAPKVPGFERDYAGMRGGEEPIARPGTRNGTEAEEAPAARMPEPASGSLFASLSQALAESRTASQPTPPAAAPASRAEAVQIPDLPDLEAFWSHLAAHPGLAAGDSAAPVTRVVRGSGRAGAPLALVGLEPGEADAAGGAAFQGEPGLLLARMLKAIKLGAETCYLTNLVKAARATRATRRDLGRLIPWLHAELALAGAPFVLLLGEACAQAVLKTGKPLDELRQEPFRLEGREFAVTYHPAELLAREELKRKAWEDLQWLRKRMTEAA